MPQWSRPIAIPNQTSKTSSALALIQGQLHLIHLGQSSDELWHSIWNGTKWSDNVKIGKQSRGRVALAGEGLLVYQSRTTQPDGSYGLVHSVFQGGWSPSRPLPGRDPITDPMTTSDSPAAVLTFGRWTVVRQVPHQDYMMGVSHYAGFSAGSVQLIESGVASELSAGVPALASDASGMHMIYLSKGTKDIWHSGPSGVARPVPNQSSQDSPAAASHNGVLHMFTSAPARTTSGTRRSSTVAGLRTCASRITRATSRLQWPPRRTACTWSTRAQAPTASGTRSTADDRKARPHLRSLTPMTTAPS